MRRHYRSFFWPVVLIVIGVFALLADLNVISTDRLYRLADLWPLILIVIGLELIARRTLHGVAVDVAAVLILLLAASGAIAYVSVGPAIPGGTHTLSASDQVGNLKEATLHVEVGAADLTVVGNSSLGPDLYRAVINYSGQAPTVALDKENGDLRISQEGDFGIFGNRHLAIDLQVSPAVSWSFNVSSGAVNATFKVTGVRVSSIQASTGAGRFEMTLGPPKGMVPIKVDGGAVTIRVHRPSGTEASARVSGGAVNLTADGRRTGAIGSARWQSDGYANAADAYSIEVSGGASTVTVDTSATAAG
jgi:Domain of unknown function (DUF5668)